MKISKNTYVQAEIELDKIVSIVNQKGGFDNLTIEEKEALEKQTEIIKCYEAQHIQIPDTFQGILE